MQKYEKLDILMQFVSAIIIALGIYFSTVSINKTNKEQYKTKYWEKQFELYNDLCNTASLVTVNIMDSVQRKIAINKFHQLYYGSLNLVEDTIVESSSINFKSKLDLLLADTFNIKLKQFELRDACFKLSKDCRKSIAISWKINLDNLSKK